MPLRMLAGDIGASPSAESGERKRRAKAASESGERKRRAKAASESGAQPIVNQIPP
jgi:hypothetical protein